MLAAGLDGMARKLPVPTRSRRTSTTWTRPSWRVARSASCPGTLSEALAELEADEVIREALGEHVFERFVEAKREEWDEYRMQVTGWETARYLEAF